MNKFLGAEELRKFSESFYADPKNILAMNSVTQNGIASVAVSRSELDRKNFTFSDLIDSPMQPIKKSLGGAGSSQA